MAQQNQKMSCRSGGSLMVFFTSVNPFMHSLVLLDKFHVTVVAVEWFLSNLNSVMHSQVIILAEFLITVVEVEWFFTSVILLYF